MILNLYISTTSEATWSTAGVFSSVARKELPELLQSDPIHSTWAAQGSCSHNEVTGRAQINFRRRLLKYPLDCNKINCIVILS